MDKIKEKLEKLRIDADSNLARAEKAEAEVKELKNELAKRETEVQNLQNKISLLQMDLIVPRSVQMMYGYTMIHDYYTRGE
ncbi:hypothetical protein BASA60_000673 [Batrachochytrium salamandrivorans]|nr:hypothetical protein BASA60_000673 [Batrachochytrium salamandrivorans]